MKNTKRIKFEIKTFIICLIISICVTALNKNTFNTDDSNILKVYAETYSNNSQSKVKDINNSGVIEDLVKVILTSETIQIIDDLKERTMLRNEEIAHINNILIGKGVLENNGKAFFEASLEYDIDYYLLIAISIHETGHGKSNIAVTKNNICGCMDSNGAKTFSSVTESINSLARNLRINYFDIGLTTIKKIAEKYAPINAENDEDTNINQYWPENIERIVSNLKS